MKALVTGGTGFIGSHAVDLLSENGHIVRLFSRKPEIPERWKGKGISVFQGDLGNPESVLDAMEGMDIFYHAGEIKNVSRAAAERNVRLVKKIVEHLSGSGIKRFVFISSITVAGVPSGTPANEDTPPAVALKDHYTDYKRRCEEIIAQGAGKTEYAILRPGVVYGPGSVSLRRMMERVKAIAPLGLPFLGNAKNLVPLIHVKDLAAAIYLAGSKPEAANQILNLTDGERHTWHDFLSAIAGAFNRKLRIIPLPPFLFRLPAVFVDMVSGLFGITPDLDAYVSYFSRDIYFDNKKAMSLLGWQPQYRDLAAGIKEMMGGDE